MKVGDPDLLDAFFAMGLAAKNLKNIETFLVRNTLSSFEPLPAQDGAPPTWRLKEKLFENQSVGFDERRDRSGQRHAHPIRPIPRAACAKGPDAWLRPRPNRGASTRLPPPSYGRWGSIHADVNGAYNILRKACPAFACHDGLSSEFELLWLGPRGLRPFASRRKEPTNLSQGWVLGGQTRRILSPFLEHTP
jgi:hypothetical protein